MRYLQLLVASIIAAAVFASPASAATKSMRPECPQALIKSANKHRDIVVDRHGVDAAGRDIVKYGATDKKKASCSTVRKYRDTLIRLHTVVVAKPAPAPVAAAPAASSSTATSAPATASTGATGSCPEVIPGVIIERESGGDPNAQNPSGAYGCYQIMPEHWNGGVCSDLGRDVGGQAECATRLWDGGNGASNWAQTYP